MLRAEKKQQIAYYVAVQAVAEWVIARLGERGVRGADRESHMEAALAELRRVEVAERSEYLWIFRDPIAFTLSEHVFDALDVSPDGSRDWLQADTASAVAAVARYDVMAAISDMWCEAADGDVEEDDAAPARGVGRA